MIKEPLVQSPCLKLYYRAIVIKWYWYRARQVDQWNRIEVPEMSPHTCGNLIFDLRELKPSSGKKDSIFNKWCWHNWQLSCRRIRIDPFLSPCTKLKYKWFKDLHIKPETLKLIEEKVGKTTEDIGTEEKFLNRTAMACGVRSRIDKWDLIKSQMYVRQKTLLIRQKAPNRLGKDL